jgi:hypothetical protein
VPAADAAAPAASPGDVVALDGRLLFPGEVGDSFLESLVMLSFPGVSPADSAAAKMCDDAAKASAEALLRTDEEKVRGVKTLDHRSCMERIGRGASVLSSGQAASVDGLLLVAVLLPMSLASAISIRDELRAAVAAGTAGLQGVVAEVVGCKAWAFCRHTGVEELRKWLGERSLEELKAIAADGGGTEWGGLDTTADQSTHDALCEAMVVAFVCSDLRADLRAALESSASDAQVEALLAGWSVPVLRSATFVERIQQAAAALDSEKKWGEVEGWVQLYRGRIQGRTRLGLKGLMAREKKKIKQYRLTGGEVLGLYLYTGPEFMPMNGICRNFPLSIADLLKGDEATADNKLCTTLFCITSGLKKLSQSTELPECRCVVTRRCMPMDWKRNGKVMAGAV